MQGIVRTQGRDLSDDDLAAIRGDRAKLVEALRRCYDLAPDKTEEEVSAFGKELRRPGSVE